MLYQTRGDAGGTRSGEDERRAKSAASRRARAISSPPTHPGPWATDANPTGGLERISQLRRPPRRVHSRCDSSGARNHPTWWHASNHAHWAVPARTASRLLARPSWL